MQEALHPKETAHPQKTYKQAYAVDFGEKSYTGSNKLANKIALITGADSGIGRAVAIAFAKEGAKAILGNCLESEKKDAETTQGMVEKIGCKCSFVPGDLSLEATSKKLVEECVKQHGQIDILVCNAAFQGKTVSSFEEMTRERVEHTFKVNIVSMFDLVRFALPHMKEGSTIITTSSIQSANPSYVISDYASTKGAIVTFTKSVARELINRGIRVNCVAPGPVLTPLVTASFPQAKIKEFGKECPLGRPAQPSEIAPVFVFLAGKESNFITGEVIATTGGMLM